MKFFLAKAEVTDDDKTYSNRLEDNRWVSPARNIAILPHRKNGHNPLERDHDYIFLSVVSKEDISIKIAEQLIIQKVIEPGEFTLYAPLEIEETNFGKCVDFRSVPMRLDPDDYLAQQMSMREYIRLIRRENNVVWNYTLDYSRSKDEVRRAAMKSIYSSSLGAELKRIDVKARSSKGADSQSETGKAVKTIPAHYIIKGNNPNSYQPALDVILESLYKNHRLPSKQVTVIDIDELDINKTEEYRKCVRDNMNEAFVDVLQYGTVVVKYGIRDRDADFNTEIYHIFKNLIDLLSERSDTIQTVFVVPEKSRDLTNRISKRFGKTLVQITPDKKPMASKLTPVAALKKMQSMAKKDGLEANEALAEMLKERMKDKSFNDLPGLYSDWKTLTLAEENHPEYVADIKRTIEDKNLQRSQSAADQLEEMIGLTSVKKQIKQVITRFKMNKELAQKGLPVQDFSMHLVFTGAPGTGKTEVARLYAEILKEEGILSEGRLIVRSGGSGFNVKKAFEEAKGSVLFVDEAYGMIESLTSITEFIAQMESNRKDTVVILAGYEKTIKALLGCNPGFKSRLGFTILFPDYTNEEKLEIFKLMAARGSFTLDEEALNELRDVFQRGGTPNDEGNGRYVRKLFEDTIGIQQLRLAENRPAKGYSTKALLQILPSDIRTAASKQLHEETGREAFEKLIGLEGIKKLVSERLDFMRAQKMKRDLGIDTTFIPMHMLFRGNPGSGKTEVARLVGRILNEEGVLSAGECIELVGNDFIKKPDEIEPFVFSLFEKAKGSVIFIDEAYTLMGHEIAVASLIAAMENYRKEVVVILAGYKNEMDLLLQTNPGFISRIKTMVDFPDYTEVELIEIMQFMVAKAGCELEEAALEKVRKVLNAVQGQEGFGNGRYVRNLLENALIAQGARLMSEGLSPDDEAAKKRLTTLSAEDFAAEFMPAKSFGFC